MAGVLAVPIHETEDEILELPKSELPDDPNEIMQILASELAPLKLWLELALAYYQQNRIQQFLLVMETSTGDEGPFYQDYYKDDRHGRIALLNCLAAYHVQMASRTRSRQTKEQYFQKATELFQQADRIDRGVALTFVGKGLVHIAKMSLPTRKGSDTSSDHLMQAGVMFDNAMECDRTCIPAWLGKASVQFNKRQYGEALKSYKQVLRLNPACPPEVRLGLAHCYAALKLDEYALKAFERVVELSPNNVEGLVGLAIIEMNRDPPANVTEEQEGAFVRRQVAKSLKYLKRAYQNNGDQNAVVLNHLANHYIIGEDLDKAHNLASIAYNCTDVKKIRAESCYHIARVFHLKKDFDQAHKYYNHAVSFWPEFLLPQFGLGQTFTHFSKYSEAIPCLDKVLQTQPNNYEARKLMGFLCSKIGDDEKAIVHLRKITEFETENKIDEEVWMELAQLLEKQNPTRALQLYHKAREVLKRKKQPANTNILNNIASLYQKQGDHSKAIKFYEKALFSCGIQVEPGSGALKVLENLELHDAMKSHAVTILYNYARLQEVKLQHSVAFNIYQTIIKERPNYMDAYLRIASICETRGNNRDASTWLLLALQVNPNHEETLLHLGKLAMKILNFSRAQKYLEKILSRNSNHALANVLLGNIFFSSAKYDTESQESDKSKGKYVQYLSRALSFYSRVIESDGSTNLLAANGAAAVIGQSGRLSEAKSIFAHLREIAPHQLPDAWINLGHIHFLQNEFTQAIKIYKAALDKFFDGHDVGLLTSIAKAEFYLADKGKTLKPSKDSKEENSDDFIAFDRNLLFQCRRTLQKAMHLAPRDWSLQFNMIFVLYASAQKVIQGVRLAHIDYSNQSNDDRGLEAPVYTKKDLEQVGHDVMVMRRIAGLLSKIDRENEFPKDKRLKSEQYEQWGGQVHELLPKYIEAVEEMQRSYEERKQEIRLKEEMKMKELEEKKERERQKLVQEREKLIQHAMELEEYKNKLIKDDDFLKAKPKQTRAKKESEMDDFIDDEAARSRLDKNKFKAEGKDEEMKELIKCMEIFLAPSDNEDADQDEDQEIQNFLSDDEAKEEEEGDQRKEEEGGDQRQEEAQEDETKKPPRKHRRLTHGDGDSDDSSESEAKSSKREENKESSEQQAEAPDASAEDAKEKAAESEAFPRKQKRRIELDEDSSEEEAGEPKRRRVEEGEDE